MAAFMEHVARNADEVEKQEICLSVLNTRSLYKFDDECCFSLYPSPPFSVAGGKQKFATPPTPALTLKHCSMALDEPDDNEEVKEIEQSVG